MKDEQQTGLPQNPGSSPEGSKGTGSRDVRWTPGPWRLGPINYADIYSTDTSELVALAIKGLPDESGHQTVANARLIAAAPELYEALDWLCAAAEEGIGPTPEHLELAQKALSKARGER